MTDKSDLGTVDLSLSGMLSPPCTCGAGEDSDHEQETVRRREERVKETEETHQQNLKPLPIMLSLRIFNSLHSIFTFESG